MDYLAVQKFLISKRLTESIEIIESPLRVRCKMPSCCYECSVEWFTKRNVDDEEIKYVNIAKMTKTHFALHGEQNFQPAVKADTVKTASSEPKPRNVIIDPTALNLPTKIELTQGGTAWVEINEVDKQLSDFARQNFIKLFQLHPNKRCSVVMYGRDFLSPRFHQSYLSTPKRDPGNPTSYMFSGLNDFEENLPLPREFHPFLNYANSLSFDDVAKTTPYNQVVVNWYEDGAAFIAPHSDYVPGLVEGSRILVMSFYGRIARPRLSPAPPDSTPIPTSIAAVVQPESTGAGAGVGVAEGELSSVGVGVPKSAPTDMGVTQETSAFVDALTTPSPPRRVFRITAKQSTHDQLFKTLDIALPHGTLLAMGGDMQEKFKHQVPPLAECVEEWSRISFTFRKYKTSS